MEQQLDARLLPAILEFMYGDPIRAVLLPPILQIVISEEENIAEKTVRMVCASAAINTSRHTWVSSALERMSNQP